MCFYWIQVDNVWRIQEEYFKYFDIRTLNTCGVKKTYSNFHKIILQNIYNFPKSSFETAGGVKVNKLFVVL